MNIGDDYYNELIAEYGELPKKITIKGHIRDW